MFVIQASTFFLAPLRVCVLWKEKEDAMSDDEMLWVKLLRLAVWALSGYVVGNLIGTFLKVFYGN